MVLVPVELPGDLGAGDPVTRSIAFPGELADLLGLDFSRQQLDAITAPLEPGVVIAGAGSGKTTVMAARVVWLVGTGQVRPEEVLGLTHPARITAFFLFCATLTPAGKASKGAGCAVRCLVAHSHGVLASKGRLPVSISKAITANE